MKKFPVAHIAFWLCSVLLLTLIYGIAFDSYRLGIVVILMLIPVHMIYFYTVVYGIAPNFFHQRYVFTGMTLLAVGFGAAVLYRINEITISDPYIYRYYLAMDPAFTWKKLDGNFWQQLSRPADFVNAAERSNVIVWIGISMKFIKMWYERRQAALQAELSFLKGQIHPHFLFNTLNNLYALSLGQSKQTPQVILGLSNILRYMLYECNTAQVMLKRDVEILQSYVALEKIRYEERLDLNFNINGDARQQKVTPLLMLPLIENAFKHGVSETVDAPWINIELQIKSDQLLLKVSNSKAKTVSNKQAFENVGLANLQKRLDLLYPKRFSLELCDEADVYIAILQLNLNDDDKNPDN
ncbi:histidine kinase [Mucilaginibacter limnophilus]|uniref:Histidine kinase n=1 Tax=Mucilaginibacter limnophilus TaxID=1932778 RepID=A0A437MZ83_9SPHI|nr:histidine kinase [Mucilaginibacter limnophilus]RVU02975.1 histidine kinase [Mucilaginibacter limnophilus]